MINTIVQTVLTGVAIFLAYQWCIRGADKPAPAIGGQQVLQATSGYRACSSLIAAAALFVAYAALHAHATQRTMAALVAIAFIVGAVYLVYQAFFIHIIYDESRIECRTPLYGTAQIMWQDVQEINCVSKRYTVTAMSGRCISFHAYRQGMEQFERFLTTRFNL